MGLAVACAIFLPLERLGALHRQPVLRREVAADLGYYFLNTLLLGVVLSGPLGFVVWGADRLLPASFQAALTELPMWTRALLALVVGEFGYYWGHRLSHEIPFLWRFHAVHHSATQMDFLVNNRAHPVDLVVARLFTFVPIYALGVANPLSPSDNVLVGLLLAISAHWSYLIHANVRWRFRWIAWLLTTPAFHHWHHTRTGAVNRNYASVLPCMDLIFGTYHVPKGEWPEAYGITETMPEMLSEQLVHPLFSQRDPSMKKGTTGRGM
ncbi:sterol desaturase family protein [Massilia arenosa]|uniref:Sterol desaturase family protein n=1 Tax=Zemynaea arenosa TaxID=2561931 RepID=A0A4Y9SRX2_9BURK|nr:sterol desaturase family protein [Massilia arenosa]